MSPAAPRPRMTPEEFLAWERNEPDRHGYLRGEVFAMAGGSPRHSCLAARAIALLDGALAAGKCRVHTSDLRLGIGEEHFVYADAVVVCGEHALRSGTTDVVTNPTLVVEVLSKSTEAYDRGEKQAAYLALPSMRHYVLISQREPRVEVYAREPDGSYRYRIAEAGGSALLDHLAVALTVDDLYAGAFELPSD